MRTTSAALLCLVSCGAPGPTAAASPGRSTASKLTITAGARTFTATLAGNETATAFAARLPITVEMRDLNANEKYHDLASELPASASRPGTIEAGDVMLYGSKTLVVFYATFPTSYSYTRVARIEDPSGLAAALGAGDVEVTFAF